MARRRPGEPRAPSPQSLTALFSAWMLCSALAAPLAGQAAPRDRGRGDPVPVPEARAEGPIHPGERIPDLLPGAPRWFPDTRLFASPRAAPLEPGLRGSALSTDLFRGDAPPGERPTPQVSGLRPGGTDFQGVVSLGDSYPVRRFGTGKGGVQVGLQVGVTARFRLATSANEYVASDWIVGLPVEFARGPVAGRLVVYHRSAHLGDEIIERAGVRRVGFGHEGVTLLVGNAHGGPLRGYAGGTRLLRSETSGTLEELERNWDDEWELQAGLELARGLPDVGSRLAGFAALDVQTAERTDWRPQWAVVTGVAFRARQRSGQVGLRLLHGPSMHGEFFLTPETAWGVELSLGR